MQNTQQQTIQQLVATRINTYVSGNSAISKYVNYSQYETINTIDAYLKSKHVSGEKDALGREKPFFNIVTAAANIWTRATDIDRKNIRFKATRIKHIIPAFLANMVLQDWMKKSNYGVYLNEWGRVLACYGSAVTKFIDKGDELEISVVPWNKLITDDLDFENNVKIYKFALTPAQLRENPLYDQEVVEQIIEDTKTQTLIGGQTINVLADYIELYEVQGYLPLSYITGKDADNTVYADQIHIMTAKGESVDQTLYSGRLKKCQYHKADLMKEENRAMGIGAVEHLFQAQWMTNHSAKLIKDQLDLSSKVFFQTADNTFLGRNALNNIEVGDIMIHEMNKPLTQVNSQSHDITSLQSFAQQWQTLGKEITSTPDAISGNTMPSGTAYRQVAILNQESHSLFELFTENKGLAIEEMMREWILPWIKKRLNNKDEIVAMLDDQQIKQFDSWYVTSEANRIVNKKIIEKALSGETGTIVTPEEQAEMLAQETSRLQGELSQLGNQRFIKPSDLDDKTWKDIFDDFDWEIEVEVTNEQTDKEAVLATLNTVLTTLATNPGVLQNPQMKFLFNKILETSGQISPLELAQIQQPMAQPQMSAPIGGV